MKRNSIVLSAALVLVTGYVAQAATVRNVTNSNTVVFYDNFEVVSPVSNTAAIDNSGDFDPVAVTGTWSVTESDGQSMIQVTDSTTSPDPGSFEGQQYLRIFRSLDNNLTSHDLNGALTAPQTTPGDVIRLNTMVYIPNDGVNFRGQLALVGTSGDPGGSGRAWARPDGAGNVMAVTSGGVIDTGLDYTPGVWQEWRLEYAIGASTFSVTVNGSTASGLNSVSSGGVGFLWLVNGNNPTGSVYFDAIPIPEPTSITLLMFGGIGLIAARRRRRK